MFRVTALLLVAIAMQSAAIAQDATQDTIQVRRQPSLAQVGQHVSVSHTYLVEALLPTPASTAFMAWRVLVQSGAADIRRQIVPR
jgi:hypothetical protein